MDKTIFLYKRNKSAIFIAPRVKDAVGRVQFLSNIQAVMVSPASYYTAAHANLFLPYQQPLTHIQKQGG